MAILHRTNIIKDMSKKIRNLLFLILTMAFASCGEDATSNEPDLPQTPPAEEPTMINGHEYVDLGLSVKWATTNVGASSPENYGGYYAWGETEEKDYYSEKTYKYKYGNSYIDIGDNICGSQYDVAHVKWGSSWRMPTYAEFEELERECRKEIAVINGVTGCKYTAKNNKSIFLPMGGWKMYTSVDDKGTDFCFWTGTKEGIRAYVQLYSYNKSLLGLRYLGLSVRPVSE